MNQKGLKIVIVEDDNSVSSLLTDYVTSWGFELLNVATDGQNALEAIELTQPNVLFIDAEIGGAIGAKELGETIPEKEYVKAVWMALHASYALEAFRFMVSFATSLAMVENKIFIGNGNIISLILQDELLHKGWTAYLINQVVKEDNRFAEAKVECEQEVYALYMDVIREEKDWATYLFKMGPVIGLNANILRDFVDYTAVGALKDIGIKYLATAPKSTPIPWFNKHTDTSKKQTALQ
jgi:ribonucleoside-diphosphate reductase beta chain